MKTIHIYSDESRHKNERFLLLSGIWVGDDNTRVALEQVRALRKKYSHETSGGGLVPFLGEFKWTKVSTRYLPVYRDLIDLFFEWIDSDTVRFCTMLIDTHDPMVAAWKNIKEEGYFKFLYQLYFHNSKIPAVYKIYPDSITNPTQAKVSFAVLERCLEAAFAKKFKPLLNPEETIPTKGFVNNITPIDSKISDFIQVVDVVMGGLGYFQNKLFENPKAKKAKVELMKYILEKIVLSGAIKFTGKSYLVARSTKFNIWLFKPRFNKEIVDGWRKI